MIKPQMLILAGLYKIIYTGSCLFNYEKYNFGFISKNIQHAFSAEIWYLFMF